MVWAEKQLYINACFPSYIYGLNELGYVSFEFQGKTSIGKINLCFKKVFFFFLTVFKICPDSF